MPSTMRISIFWDLKSCPSTVSLPSSDLINNIAKFTSRLGYIASIKAYWDPRTLDSHTLDSDIIFRNDAACMGVSLVDCSLMKGPEDSSITRMITVDALISAIDHPVDSENTNSIIMIFSGDESLSYPISLLAFRNHTIYLIVPDDVKTSTSWKMATRIFSWEEDILGLSPAREHSGSFRTVHANQTSSRVNTTISLNPGPSARTIAEENRTQKHGSTSRPVTLPEGSISRHFMSPSSFNSAPTGTYRNSGPGPDESTTSRARSRLRYEPGPNEKVMRYLESMEWPESTASPIPNPRNQTLSPELESDTSAFLPLLQILQRYRAEGRDQVLRSVIGGELAKHRDIYKTAGATNFTSYVALAESRGLIVLGGTAGKEWMALKSNTE